MEGFISILQKNAFEKLDIDGYSTDTQGWMDESLSSIFKQFLRHDTKLIIEVGTWKGLSTVTMADCIKQTSNCSAKIVAVDTWLGAPEFWTWGLTDPTRGVSLRCENGYPQVFYTFTKNVKYLKHDDIIAPFPISSAQGADVLKFYNAQADIIYVDAAHEYEPVKVDIKNYWALLKPGGYMFGDDYSEDWRGVVAAVDEFVREKRLKLVRSGVIWIIQKPVA
jgi:predicted O-methyltransferase YrrM